MPRDAQSDFEAQERCIETQAKHIRDLERIIELGEQVGRDLVAKDKRISELEAALLRVYQDVIFMVECNVIPNVLDDVIYAEVRRVLGPASPN